MKDELYEIIEDAISWGILHPDFKEHHDEIEIKIKTVYEAIQYYYSVTGKESGLKLKEAGNTYTSCEELLYEYVELIRNRTDNDYIPEIVGRIKNELGFKQVENVKTVPIDWDMLYDLADGDEARAVEIYRLAISKANPNGLFTEIK